MRRLLILLLLFIFYLHCSEPQPQKKLSFKPELIIGENTEIEGGWFSTLTGFCVLPNENIYCVDGEDRKIKVFDKSGRPLFSFGQKGKGPGEFIYPTEIVASKNNDIYVLDPGRRNISKFTEKGKFVNSTNIEDAVAKLDIFDSGNLVLEIAKINIKNIQNAQYKLLLFDSDLTEIKDSIYEKQCSHLTWVQSDPDGRMFTQEIPYAPKIQWKIMGDRLYVGYNENYKISIFDSNGEYINAITKEIKNEDVTRTDKDIWIKNTLNKFSNRANFFPEIMSKSMEKVTLPNYKPAFSKIAKFSNGLVVFLDTIEEGTQGILYDKNDEEISQAIFEHDDFTYIYGKYYRITGGKEEPYTLTRYVLAD